jgi:Tfp pilus assembly protein FimT
LVELVTVIAVIAVTAAVAIPLGLNYVRHYEVQGAAQGVASMMQLTRAQSVKRNTRRGLILNFNYPNQGEYQFTSLEEDPVNGGYDNQVYVDPGGNFDPGNRAYSKTPADPFNFTRPPHGQVIRIPDEIEFIDGQAFGSLLFRVDGSVEAVSPTNFSGSVVAQDGLDWVVRVRHPRYGLTRTVRISRGGRVMVENP